MTDHLQQRTDASFGVIPVRWSQNDWHYLLIHHQAGHWGFPKGHPEADETEQQTACREFEEETGITAYTLYPWSTGETYEFTSNDTLVRKTVRYHLVVCQQSTVTIQVSELQQALWLDYENAMAQLSFSESQAVLQRVHHAIPHLNLEKTDQS